MVRYRSGTDITTQILEAALEPSTQTAIMFRSYAAHRQVIYYLSPLLQNGLIDYMAGEKKYKSKQEGIKFLEVYEQIEALAGLMATAVLSE